LPVTTVLSSRLSRPWARCASAVALLGLLVAGCGGGGGGSAGGGGGSHGGSGGSSGGSSPPAAHLTIAPGGAGLDTRPDHGITVRAAGGKITKVVVHTRGERVSGKLNASGTRWHSTWALDVASRYTVVATAVGTDGRQVTRTSSFRTVTPAQSFDTRIIEGAGQTYGVGMPIILYFSRPITDRAAVERSLEVRTSKPVVGSWYWDSQCGTAPMCLYFRPKHYWAPHTRVSFTGHLNGVEVAPGVYGHHTLSQRFTIGGSLIVVATTAGHYMKVIKDGKLFARWPISTGRPGDDTPNGNYLTIEKANPADMVGPGYNIQVPWSVRFTFSGDYLHDAYWSVGDQGFTNVSHGCVNMAPANAETYYNMAVPGDPVKIVGSPRAGDWDNGWTMWFLSWRHWLHGSALHSYVRAGRHGSTFVHI
jgi:lipoprotein-anchoring transpeptidase ErfK/SrfK